MILRLLELEDRGGGDQGNSNATNSVTVVPACPTGYTRVVENLTFVNLDTGSVTARFRKTIAGPTHYQFDVTALAQNASATPVTKDTEIRLEDGESLTMVLDSDPTTEGDWVSSWRDVPIATND